MSNTHAGRLVIPFEELRMTDVEVVGGKNASLGELISQLSASGVQVPGGFATTADAFRDFLDHNRLTERINARLATLNTDDVKALAQAGVDDALVPPRYRSTYFSHVFAGGYSAAYYAYIWSEVMDADAIEWFTTDGAIDGDLGLNRRAGEIFRREFLSRGDCRDPLVSYRAFTGREPGILPLLQRRGLA